MRRYHHLERRTFLTATAGALGALAFGSRMVNSAGAQASKRDAAALQALMNEMDAKGRQFLSVPKKDGQYLNLMVKSSEAKNILEIGTSHGYSAIWMGLALEETGGKLTTIEIDPERVKLAKEHVAKAQLSDRVTFKQGDAHQIVTTLEGPFDFVFLDADKEGQMDYFKKLFPKKLAPGALLVVHNAIRAANSMKDYLEMISNHPEFDSVVLSVTMEDGFSVSYRKRQTA